MKTTQKQIILDYLIKHGNITTMEAMKKLDITDPQHSIMLLRRDGYQITDIWEKSKKGKKYKRYFLGGLENDC